jgi:spermidine synthase
LKKLSELRALPYQQGGEIIHISQDDHGRILVIDDGDHRVLNFDSLFEQSCMQLSCPYQLVHEYTQLMLLVLAFIEPGQITFFGLGGGSLLRTLHHVLPDCHFSVVELRQTVVDIAKDYFSLPSDHRVTISVNDAVKEISQIKSGSSDIVFSDMYDAYKMVPAQVKSAYLSECSRILSEQGWLVVNLHSLPGDKSGFFEVLGELFPTVIVSATADNTILLASKAEPLHITPSLRRIETMDRLLQQRVSRLLPKLRPLDFEFES